MRQFFNRPGNVSLLGCASALVFVLALMTAHRWPVGDWGAEELLLMGPYVAITIAGAVSWGSPFFSRWVLACVVTATVANPAVWYLVYFVSGGRENVTNTWYLFIGAVIAWDVLGGFLVVAVLVRLYQWVRRRPR